MPWPASRAFTLGSAPVPRPLTFPHQANGASQEKCLRYMNLYVVPYAYSFAASLPSLVRPLRPQHAAAARWSSAQPGGARQSAAWTCCGGWGRLKPQGFLGAKASGRATWEGRGGTFLVALHNAPRQWRDFLKVVCIRSVGVCQAAVPLRHVARLLWRFADGEGSERFEILCDVHFRAVRG